MPGKSIKEKKRLLEKKAIISSEEAQKINESFDNFEESVQKILQLHSWFRTANIRDLLFQTDFFDRFIDRKNQNMINLIVDFFKNNLKEFHDFLVRTNPYLCKINTKYSNDPRGFVHIFENTPFAQAVLDKIPTSIWKKQMVLALGCNTLHKDTHITIAENFIQKLETIPEDRLKRYSGQLFGMFKRIFLSFEEDHDTYSLNNLRAFLTTPKTNILKQRAVNLFNKLSDKRFEKITNNIKENEIKSFCTTLIKTSKSRKRLLNLSLPNGTNLVWTAFEKGLLKQEEMGKLLSEAMSQNNFNFLFAKKDIELTPDFPQYTQLCSYFKDQTKALRFINSFNTPGKTKESSFNLVKDFIKKPKMLLKIASIYQLINHWAKEDKTDKMFQFFFNGEISKPQDISLKLPLAQVKEFFLKQDKQGKTPWHHLCMKRNRFFFSKNFKSLHPFFLESCSIKDKDGKTPLDYISDDLKFKKVLVEKIPAVEKIMSDSGFSLEYKPKTKETQKEKQNTEQQKKIEEKEQKKETFTWKIQVLGHDKLRRNPEFNALVLEEIKQIPAPHSGPICVANQRLQKKEVFDAPVLKIWYENKRWRVPFLKYDTSGTIYLLPASDRNETYTKQDYCRIIRNYVKWLKRQSERTRS